MGDEGTTGGEQLGSGGLDEDVTVTVGAVEGQPVVGAGVVAGLELGLGDGRGEGDVPQGRGVVHVRLAARQIAQEGQLGDPLGLRGNRRVELVPVHRQTDRTPQVLEGLLVDGSQLDAQLDEVPTADCDLMLGVGLGRRSEVRVIGERGIAAHTVVVLYASLGRKTVVVPTHRVEDLLAAHPLVAGDGVGVGVGEDVTRVQVSGDGGRWGVDREHLVTGVHRGGVEGVKLLVLPDLTPLVLEALEDRLVRYDATRRGRSG